MSKPTLQDMLAYQDAFVKPLVEAVKAEVSLHLAPLVESQKVIADSVQAHESRINVLEKGQKRALVGYGVYATAVAAGMAASWTWLKSKFHFSWG